MKKYYFLFSLIIYLIFINDLYSQNCPTCCSSWVFPVRECVNNQQTYACENCDKLNSDGNANKIYKLCEWPEQVYWNNGINPGANYLMPDYITDEELETAITNAIAPWNNLYVQCCIQGNDTWWTLFSFSDQSLPLNPPGYECYLTIEFTNDQSNIPQNDAGDPYSEAYANTRPDPNESVSQGFICNNNGNGACLWNWDILLNNTPTNPYNWVATPDQTNLDVCMEDVIFHELGHALGLLDLVTINSNNQITLRCPSPTGTFEDDPDALMYGVVGTEGGPGPNYYNVFTRLDMCYFEFMYCCSVYEENESNSTNECDAMFNEYDDAIKMINNLSPSSTLALNIYPNPVNGGHMIVDFQVEKQSNSFVAIYDIAGKYMGTVYSGLTNPYGRMVIDYDATALASGNYICILRQGEEYTKYNFTVKK